MLLVPNDKYRPCGEVAPRDKAEEVNQRDASAHEFTESNIIRMVRIGAPIRVAEPAFTARVVIVGRLYGSAYRQRQLARRRLENTRHADEWNANAAYLKAALQDRPVKDIVVFGNPFGEPAKGGTAYRGVTHGDGPVRTGRTSPIAFSLDSVWRARGPNRKNYKAGRAGEHDRTRINRPATRWLRVTKSRQTRHWQFVDSS